MNTYEDIAKLFKVLSEPHRVRILFLLQEKTLCVCEITEILGLAPSTVSSHLSVLLEAGFIQQERDGKWINYFINPRMNAKIKPLLTEVLHLVKTSEEGTLDSARARNVSRTVIRMT